MRKSYLILCLIAAFQLPAMAVQPPEPVQPGFDPGPVHEHVWAAWGGELGFIWNEDLLHDVGVSLEPAVAARDPDQKGFIPIALREAGGLEFVVHGRSFDHFVGGSLNLRGGFALQLPDGNLSLVDARLQPRSGDPLTLDLVDANGKTWFYLDQLMYELVDNGARLAIRTMDLRIAPELANRIHHPEIANWEVAQLRMDLNVFRQGDELPQAPGAPNWPGNAAPTGTYQADVFLQLFTAQYSRCSSSGSGVGSCDGPGGATDGGVIFTPSSTLKNNVNNGTLLVTVTGDPNGTSTALYAADVPWYSKFSGTFAPYNMDQHPFLIWNLYRIDAQGRLQQIGRSGLKHAFVSTNTGSGCDGSNGGHVLGRSCGDTYPVGNNDSNSDLGPRTEIIPNKGQWGRCGSIFDPDCDGNSNSNGVTNFTQRLVTKESQIDPAANPGATYYFESWYIVRDDINIYNTMGSRPVTMVSSGSMWPITNGDPYLIGPAINRWVSPTTTNPNQSNVDNATPEGHVRVAVKATDLGDGTWRYDYAVENFDFSRAVTSGTPEYTDDADPLQRFRVIRNLGLDSFHVAVPADVALSGLSFADIDTVAANDWTNVVDSTGVTWTAPAGNELNWGTLFRFSFVSGVRPVSAKTILHVAETTVPGPATYAVDALAPDSDRIFADFFGNDEP